MAQTSVHICAKNQFNAKESLLLLLLLLLLLYIGLCQATKAVVVSIPLRYVLIFQLVVRYGK